jgi:SP family sugar:H+ symporter-like MFS transporter
MSDDASNSSVITPIANDEKKVDDVPRSSQDQLQTLPNKGFKEYIGVTIYCLLIAFGGFVFGFDTGTISGFVNMTDFIDRFGQVSSEGTKYLSDVRVGLMVSIFNIGCAVGAVGLSKVGDMRGRRVGIVLATVVYIVGVIVQIASQTAWYQYFIGRIITGLAVGSLSVLCPLFISETSPKAIRGTLVYCFQLCITLGIFLGYCTCYGTKKYPDSRQWRVPLGLCFAWALLLLVGMSLMPESPRYLVEKDKIEDAKVSLAKCNKLSPEDPAIYAEIQLIQAGVDRERLAGKASWIELFNGKPKIFYRVVVGVMLQSLQQLTGDNYFFYYGTTIFKAVGIDSFITSIILGVVNFLSTFLGIYLIERLGRRKCLIGGSIGMSVCFLIYSILGSVHLYIDGYDGPTRTSTGDALIFITCLYILFFASTWAGGCFAVVSELYPLRIRTKAMATSLLANWIWGFLISFFTTFITSDIHFYYGFVFFGCLIFSIFFVYFGVHETKGLSLEEIDELFASGVTPMKSSGWVPPTREEMANGLGYAAEAKPENEHV